MSKKIENKLNQIGKETVKVLLENKNRIDIFSFLETYFKLVNREKNKTEILQYIQRYDFTYKTLSSLIAFLLKIADNGFKEKVDQFLEDVSKEYPVDEWFYKNRLPDLQKEIKSIIIRRGDVTQIWEDAVREVFTTFIKFSKKFIAIPEDDYEIFEIERKLKKTEQPRDFITLSKDFYNLIKKLSERDIETSGKKSLFSKVFGKDEGPLDDTLKEIIEMFVKNMQIFLELDESLEEKVKALENRLKAMDSQNDAEKFKKILKDIFFKLEFVRSSVEKEKEELKDIIFLMTDTLKNFIGEGNDFSKHLDNFIVQLKETDDVGEIKKLKFEIIKATLLVKEKTDIMKKELSEANERIMESQKRLKELEKELDQAKEKALYDGLTGVYNRASFNDRIKIEVEKAKRTGRSLFIVMLDLDHFKQINDNYGHQTGDMVLKIFAAQTKKVIRNIDFLGRYGGEEFVVLLPEITEERALDIAERIRSKIEKTKLIYDKKTFKVTVSIGMTSLKKDDTVESFVERADKALYKAKESGRNKVVIF